MIGLLLAMTLNAAPVADDAPPVVRRFALLVGANDGGGGRQKLRYAVTDAASVGAVLRTLGGVDANDLVVVEEPDVRGFRQAFATLTQRIQAARARDQVEVVFYYSGHSDEAGLLLQGNRVSYRDIRALLEQVPADVHIAVLDSCSSGSLMRSKGGTPRPPFLSDVSTAVTGHAFLTSASDDEAAQESDRIKGSFFTSALLSALRGAADANRDQKVTLNEAYQYAFHETLAQTETTAAGPQRPGFDIEMVGRGDLVLTDTRSAGATLVIPPGGGRLFIHLENTLVAELAVPGTRSIELGLVPATYRLVLVNGDVTRSSVVTLAVGARLEVQADQMSSVTREATVRRGGSATGVFLGFGFIPPIESNTLFGGEVRNHLQIAFPIARSAELEGVAVGLGLSVVSGRMVGAQLIPAIAIAGRGTGVQAGAVSWVREDFTGVQSGAVVKAERAHGLQLGVGANIATAGFLGAQLGLINVGGGPSTGAQVGVLNIGSDVTGAQVGVVNIAGRSTGLQLGVLNLSKEADAPVGVLSISGSGGVHVTAAATETLPLTVGVKLGARNVYGLLTGGMSFRQKPTYGWGLGLGWRLSTEKWRFAVESIAQSIHLSSRPTWQGTQLLTSLRFNVGYRLTPWLSVYAGPSLNVLVDFSSYRAVGEPLAGYALSSGPGAAAVLYPGLQLGVEL